MNIIYLSVLGAALSLDTAAAFQLLIAQPIVACSIIGWVGNDAALGLHIGFLFQLIWLFNLPVGAAIVPAGNPAAIIATIVALYLEPFKSVFENMLILLTVAYALGLSYIGAKIVTFIRTSNIFFLNRILRSLEKNISVSVGLTNALALVFHFFVMLTFILISAFIGKSAFESLLKFVPESWDKAARYVEIALLGAGIGLTLNMYNKKRFIPFMAAGCAAGALFFLI